MQSNSLSERRVLPHHCSPGPLQSLSHTMALSSSFAESSYYNEDDDGTSVFTQLPEYASGVGTIDTIRNPPTYISRMDGGGGPSRLGRRGSRSSFYPAQTLGTPYEYTLPIPKPKDATLEKKKPWLTWKIADPRRSTCPPKFPTFAGGQNVTGEVLLDLDGSVKITSISLRVSSSYLAGNVLGSDSDISCIAYGNGDYDGPAHSCHISSCFSQYWL